MKYGKTTRPGSPDPKRSGAGSNMDYGATSPAPASNAKGPGSKEKCRTLMSEDNVGTAKDRAKGGV